MRKIPFIILFAAVGLLLGACSKQYSKPAESSPVEEQAEIFPEYRDIVIPPNIAPLNVQIKSAGEAFVGVISDAEGREITASAEEDGKLLFDSAAWHNLLDVNKGNELQVQVYALRGKQWVSFPAWKLSVALEPIDRYLSYRLIEPGYELYRQLGLYQRDLEGFTQRAIYENNRSYDPDNNHCVNCHNFQNYSTKNMLFHVRAKHGGTVFLSNGKGERVDMKSDSVLANAVYPSWHPTENWVVFSSNLTGQAFHLTDKQKIEVIDYGSDLVFYDVEKKELSNILKTNDNLETFPCWNPEGTKVYYCSAFLEGLAELPDSTRPNFLIANYDKVRYNLMSIPFDKETRSFGEPVMEVNCDSLGKSATVPRVSPDGRYLLFTLGDFGQFHVWHTTSDLYIKDLLTGEIYPLSATNSNNADSYHTWSSNGRWMVFSSRRDDGSYTRPYIAYFDRNAQGHRAFLLPQEDPEQHLLLMKSYNVPELTRDAVSLSAEEVKDIVYDDNSVQKVVYKSSNTQK